MNEEKDEKCLENIFNTDKFKTTTTATAAKSDPDKKIEKKKPKKTKH